MRRCVSSSRPLNEFSASHALLEQNVLLGHPNARSTTALAVISTAEPLGNADSDRPSVIGTLTWAELYDAVRIAAHALRTLGVVTGDRVASYSASNAEIVVANLAASLRPSLEEEGQNADHVLSLAGSLARRSVLHVPRSVRRNQNLQQKTDDFAAAEFGPASVRLPPSC